MKAVAVTPGKAGSARLVQLPDQHWGTEGGSGKDVLVRALNVGLDGTDRQTITGQYGAPPEGHDFLVPGHESIGVVEQRISLWPNLSTLDGHLNF